MLSRILLAAAAIAAIPCFGSVQVKWVEPEKYMDSANQRWETSSTLDALERHMKLMGDRYLAPDETLRVEVLDLDLAGWARFGGLAPNDVRTVRGKADAPSMRFRYTLESKTRPQSGEADLTDLGYQNHGLVTRGSSEPYYYEKRMLEDWFRSTFAQRAVK